MMAIDVSTVIRIDTKVNKILNLTVNGKGETYLLEDDDGRVYSIVSLPKGTLVIGQEVEISFGSKSQPEQE